MGTTYIKQDGKTTQFVDGKVTNPNYNATKTTTQTTPQTNINLPPIPGGLNMTAADQQNYRDNQRGYLEVWANPNLTNEEKQKAGDQYHLNNQAILNMYGYTSNADGSQLIPLSQKQLSPSNTQYGTINPTQPSDITGTVNGAAIPGMNWYDQYKINQYQSEYKMVEADPNIPADVKSRRLAELHAAAEEIRNKYGFSGGVDGSELNYIIDPRMRQLTDPYNVEDMAALTGVTVNAQELANIFQKATRAEFDLKEKALDQANVDFNNGLYKIGEEVQDAVNKSMGESAVSGAQAGVLAATNLLNSLGISQQGVDENKSLAEERATLGEQLGAALKADTEEAVKQAENAKQVLAQLAATIQGNTVQEKVGQRSADATIDSTKISTAGSVQNQDTSNNTEMWVNDQKNLNNLDVTALEGQNQLAAIKTQGEVQKSTGSGGYSGSGSYGGSRSSKFTAPANNYSGTKAGKNGGSPTKSSNNPTDTSEFNEYFGGYYDDLIEATGDYIQSTNAGNTKEAARNKYIVLGMATEILPNLGIDISNKTPDEILGITEGMWEGQIPKSGYTENEKRVRNKTSTQQDSQIEAKNRRIKALK